VNYKVGCVLLAMALPSEAMVKMVGQELPELKDRALDGEMVTLPNDARGYVTLVAFGFKRESQYDIDDWLAAAPREFEDPRRFRTYEIPMMGNGLVKLLRGSINGGMRSATPVARRRFVVPFYGDINAYARRLGMSDRGAVYILLLDKQGIVRWWAKGKVTREKSAELAARALELAGP
jgi:hypothetical protein